MADYLVRGAIVNAVNFPSVSAEEAPKLRPFIALAEKLGSFVGQLAEVSVTSLSIAYEGQVAEMNGKALTSAALAGLLRPVLQQVNFVSAPTVARERGIVLEETTRAAAGEYESLITLTAEIERRPLTVGGTVYADGRPRIVNINGIRMDAGFGPSMIYIVNLDKPGFISEFGTTLGGADINIATFHVGATRPAATRSRSWKSTASFRPTCWPASSHFLASSRRSR
jgi:D-3-phosphoglycerate dehydrogenase